MSEQHRYQHQCNADLPTRIVLRKEGAEQERERIIKLLTNCDCHPEDENNCFAATYVCDVIELINGENK